MLSGRPQLQRSRQGLDAQAEQAATDPAERERMHQARMAIEQQRLDYEAAEKQRKADEDAPRHSNGSRQQARAEVHAARSQIQRRHRARAISRFPGGTAPSPPAKPPAL